MPRAIPNETYNGMRPELELVIRSARARSPENDERVRALLAEALDWSEVLGCAIQHKLVAFLNERIAALDAFRLPAEQRERLGGLARDLAKNNLVYTGELLKLYAVFEAAQIPAIPFKGPALSWLAYPKFAHRVFVDLDFVVPQRYIPEAVSALQAHGFKPQFSPREAQAGPRGPAPGEYAFMSSVRHIFVELHTERTLRYFSRPLNLEAMNARLAHLQIAGRSLRTFSVEDLLVMLCVHGAKHFWERLGWIVDIAQLITVCEVDWTVLFEIAEQVKSTRLVLLGLYLAHEVIGASLPPSVLERARKDRQVRWLAGKVLAQYSGKSDPGVGVLPRAVFRLRSGDGFWTGLRQLFRLSLRPTESDRQKLPLPGYLSFFYALLRPVRLVEEYGLGWRRKSKPDLAVYVPTPPEIVDHMLLLAEITPGDVLYDLGCGDGRIVVAAAEKYGIRAVGVDIDPTRVAAARANARRRGVEKRVQFILGDAKTADLQEATVITMYLGEDGNLRLADRLRAQLRSGARIVSRDFRIYGWTPERSENRITAMGAPTSLYRWTIKEAENELPAGKDAVPELRRTRKAGG